MNHSSNETLIHRYEEAVEYIERLGILPLASIIPEYPSLESITPKESWHSETIQDPWGWRVRFPLEGKAAYGKFFKKKAILISAEWFPWLYISLRLGADAETCYRDGLLSQTAWQLYQLVDMEPGIDTRVLRSRAQMKAKEDKKAFDQAVVELQEALLIVISGVTMQVDDNGEQKGWSSTSYETTTHWMRQSGIREACCTKVEAREELLTRLRKSCSDKAFTFFSKLLQT